MRRFTGLLRRSIPVVLLCAILGVELSALSLNIWWPPQYRALATLLVDVREDAAAPLTLAQLDTAKQVANTCAALITNDDLLENVLQTARADGMPLESVARLRQRVTACVAADTPVLQLSVQLEDPALALAVLQGLVAGAPGVLSGFVAGGTVRVVSPPRLQEEPIGPGWLQAMLYGGASGLVLCVLWLFICAFGTRRFVLEEDVEARLGLPLVGCLPPVRGKARAGGVLAWRHGVAPAAYREAIAVLCVNLHFLWGGKPLKSLKNTQTANPGGKVLLVFGAAPRVGTSSVVVNVAAGLAQAGQRVLVVDANLRAPALQTVTEETPPAVLQDALQGMACWEDCVYPAAGQAFWVLPARPQAGGAIGLPGREALREILAECARQYDMIILDSSAALSADAAVLSQLADGVLLVLRQRSTSVGQALGARRSLDATGAQWLGVVGNEFDMRGL